MSERSDNLHSHLIRRAGSRGRFLLETAYTLQRISTSRFGATAERLIRRGERMLVLREYLVNRLRRSYPERQLMVG